MAREPVGLARATVSCVVSDAAMSGEGCLAKRALRAQPWLAVRFAGMPADAELFLLFGALHLHRRCCFAAMLFLARCCAPTRCRPGRRRATRRTTAGAATTAAPGRSRAGPRPRRHAAARRRPRARAPARAGRLADLLARARRGARAARARRAPRDDARALAQRRCSSAASGTCTVACRAPAASKYAGFCSSVEA